MYRRHVSEAPHSYPPPQTTSQSTNGYAVASLVLGITGLAVLPVIASVLALVFGYMGRNEIDRSGGAQGGRGLAVAGIVLGWVGVAFGFLILLLFLAIISASTSFS
jgi:hypothetical protein